MEKQSNQLPQKNKRKKKKLEKVTSLRKSGKIMTLFFISSFLILMTMIAIDFAKVSLTGTVFGVDLNEKAVRMYLRNEVIRSRRGSIYDRDGLALAEELTSYTIYANLNPNYGSSFVSEPREVANLLSQHISMSADEIYERLTPEPVNGKSVSQVEFGAAGRGLTYIQKKNIEELNIPGIGFNEHSKRFYANGIFASHSLGYAVYDNEVHRLVGHMGLELAFDEMLSGENGERQYFKDRKGYLLPNTTSRILVEPKQGYDIYTTIDFTIQNLLEEALSKADEEFDPSSLIGIIADAKTGEILAISNRKTFDPNLRDVENYYNPAIQYPFEVGSTLKIFTYAAAIDSGKYNSNQYYPTGSIEAAKMRIKDWKPQGWGSISLDQGFYVSANTSIINLLTKHINTDTFTQYLEAFGFGSSTNVGLPGESSGTLPRENDYTNQLTSGFGQGFLATPMQIIKGLTAITNDGELLQPQIISKVYDPNTDEYIYENERTVVGQPIKDTTAKKLRELMYGVVHDEKFGSGYTAYRMVDQGIELAGKTGTAQIADEQNGGYLRGSNDYVYSFTGFAPYDNPQYIFYFSVQQPKPGRTGGHGILGEVLKYVLGNTLGQGDVTEFQQLENNENYQLVEVGDYLNKTVEESIIDLESKGLSPIVLGDGEVIFNQMPHKETSLFSGDKVILITGKEFIMPNLYGWTKTDLMQLKTLTGLEFIINGNGLVYEQSITEGSLISLDNFQEVITLSLIEDLSQLYQEEIIQHENESNNYESNDFVEEIQ